MHIRNYEFKARIEGIEQYEQQLLKLSPRFVGEDHQIDTYFNAPQGRLKLREGNIENALIHYDRQDLQGSKLSNVILYKHKPDGALKDILIRQLGIKVVVDKRRRIYFIDNVKFHLDRVAGLGTFLEVEAIDDSGCYTIEELKEQCDKYYEYFELNQQDLIEKSYSDLLLEQQMDSP